LLKISKFSVFWLKNISSDLNIWLSFLCAKMTLVHKFPDVVFFSKAKRKNKWSWKQKIFFNKSIFWLLRIPWKFVLTKFSLFKWSCSAKFVNYFFPFLGQVIVDKVYFEFLDKNQGSQFLVKIKSHTTNITCSNNLWLFLKHPTGKKILSGLRISQSSVELNFFEQILKSWYPSFFKKIFENWIFCPKEFVPIFFQGY